MTRTKTVDKNRLKEWFARTFPITYHNYQNEIDNMLDRISVDSIEQGKDEMQQFIVDNHSLRGR